jgi:topoisomerase (DNA) II binding protein 1
VLFLVGSVTEDLARLVDGLDIKKAKKAGQYLDGYSVYLTGFLPEQREKLSKVLNLSGATRYDDISDRLTHIIVGDTSCHQVKIIKSKNYSASLVSVHWLLDSIEKQQAVDEENYLINLHDIDKEQFSSPLGRKGLSLLRSNKTLTPNDIQSTNRSSPELEVDNDLMQQYLKPASKDDDSDTLVNLLKNVTHFDSNTSGSTKQTDTSTQNSEFDDRSRIFQQKKFLIVSFTPEECNYIKEQIESLCGCVVSKTYKGIPDYVVAPRFVQTSINISALEIVNNLWVEESIYECEEVNISYYHRPFVVGQKKPLENRVVTISGYTNFERTFLKELIEVLGGVSQEQFARVQCVEKNVLASTHLVSLKPEGKKYVAALKWELPVVSKDWLLECANVEKMVAEDKFLIGDAKVASKPDAFPEAVSENLNLSLKSTPNLEKQPAASPFFKNKGILTPITHKQPLNISKSEQTPVNFRLCGTTESPDSCSQVTPINKLMEEVRKTNLLGTPQTPPVPKSWYDIKTPDSPFGAFIRPHLSPKSKKELMRYINRIPDFVPPPKERRNSTPLSEVKRRCWKKLLGQQDSPSQFTQDRTEASTSQTESANNDDKEQCQAGSSQINCEAETDSEANVENVFINTKLKQIEDMVNAIGGSRRSSKGFQSTVPVEVGNASVKDSQPFTVGWDYCEEIVSSQQIRIFVISGLEADQRESVTEKIEGLGGRVSDLNSYDPKCTHLICPKPARNEKTLSCMAAGKWILHVSYVDKCVAAGKFLPEENFEFGNPKSKENIPMTSDAENEHRIQCIHWWRKEIARRGYGAFNDMRAIVVAQKREPIVRVIEAGGGTVVDAMPPFDEDIHATHCLLEVRSVSDFSLYNRLAEQGILCLNTLYISDFLYRTNKDIKDAIVPHFTKFYS